MIKIFALFQTKDISSRDYDKFIDTGKVSEAILQRIAKKVMKQEKLETRETAIFFSKTSEIDQIILKLHKS
jgi:hypothetical protein